MTNRRDFLKVTGAGLLALGAPFPFAARANPLVGGDLKFIFLFNQGGWDPTRVFATEFDNGDVDMEAGAGLSTAGGLSWVSHADRPSVDTFMETWHEQTLIVNGILVRSISHEICTMISMTGGATGSSPDWPAVLANQDSGRFILPHLVLSGPSYPGDLGVVVSRTGSAGQLEALLDGSAVQMSDLYPDGPSRPAEGVMDRYMLRRSAARADAAKALLDAELTADFDHAMQQVQSLKDMQYVMDFSQSSTFQVAVDALSLGVSRCVTVGFGGVGDTIGWDSHSQNDETQSQSFETLFNSLSQVMSMLKAAPGESGGSLADETVIVVCSEMGRTPQLNAFDGKDHWPYTSAMIVGPGVQGDRVVGGFDSNYYGLPVDPASGEVDENNGQILSAEAMGATLLAMADVDPDPYVSGVEPIEGVLG